MKQYLFIVLGILVFAGCSYEFPAAPAEEQLDTGSANFDRFTILGGVISAGLMDGALYKEGQEQAYPALVAAILEQGLQRELYSSLNVETETGYNFEAEQIFGSGAGRFKLLYRNEEDTYPARMPVNGDPLENYGGELSEVANLSIPGLRITGIDSVEALVGNPFFDRLDARTSGHSLLDIAISRKPSLVLLQPGRADLYKYVIAGASGEANPSAGNIGTNDLTPVPVFEQKLENIVNRMLLETSADMIVTTIPDPLKLPYLTTLPWYLSIDQVRHLLRTKDLSFYDEFNIEVQEYNRRENASRPVIVFDTFGDERSRGLVIIDEYLSNATANDGTVIPKWRQLSFDDLLLYNAEKAFYESIQSDYSFGTTLQLADKFVITIDEQVIINERRTAYNDAIKELTAVNSRLHLLDFASLIDRVGAGEVYFDGVGYRLDFSQQGIISADGHTLNPRGQALLANLLVRILNEKFSARIPRLDVNARRGNIFENGF